MNCQSSQRLLWPDYAKGISVVLITIYHTIGGIIATGRTGVTTSPWLSNTWDFTHDFRVSVFFLLSGFMAQRTLVKHGKKQVVGSVFKSIVYPYVLWSVIQAILLITTKAGNTVVNWVDIPSLIVRGWMEFWFLHTLIMIFGLDLALRAMGRNTTFRLMTSILLIIGASFFPRTALSNLTDYYLYFVLGGILTGYNLNFSRSQLRVMLLGGSATFLFFHFHGCEFETPLFPASALSGIVACLALSMLMPDSAWLTPLRLIGKYSLQGFCLHVMFAAGIRSMLLKLGYTNFYGHCVIGCLVGLCFPVIVAVIDEKHLGFLFRLPKRQAPKDTVVTSAAAAATRRLAANSNACP